jgi:CheY-like chemotaxis protein
MPQPTPAAGRADAPGILYYDPNRSTARIATAGLRLGGFQVFAATEKEEAVELCKAHGSEGDGTIVAILLDASVHPKTSALVLKALAQLPGADELPGILLVSRRNPRPIPGAEALPSLARPFSTPALVRIVRETIEDQRPEGARDAGTSETGHARLEELLAFHFPDLSLDDENVRAFAADLLAESTLPDPPAGVALQGDLAIMKLEAVLEMLGEEGVTGILTVSQEHGATSRLHLDCGRIRLAEIRGTDEDLKLGRFVVEGGFMRDDELEEFIAGEDPQGRLLGERLVEGGFLTPPDLAAVLASQAREVTCHLLTWEEGAFHFTHQAELHPLARAAATDGRAELLVCEALLDGLRRLDEGAVMGPHMAQVDDVYMRIDEQIAKIGRHALTLDELAVLELLNGRNSVKEIARKTRTGTFAVARVLYRLTKARLARRRMMPVTI